MKVEQDPKLSSGASLDYQQRHERGRAARRLVPRGSHAQWAPMSDRPDPVELLEAQARDRIQELLPIRYGRMMASPFAFLRGSAIVMAQRPRGHPEERHPGPAVRRCPPVELRGLRLPRALPALRPQRLRRDPAGTLGVGRQAPRGELRGGWPGQRLRCGGLPRRRAGVTASYRQRMAEFSEMGELEVWYSRIGEEEVRGLLTEARAGKRTTKKLSKNVRKTRGRDSLQAFSKLTTVVDGRRMINDDPPLLVRVPEEDEVRAQVYAILESYKRTLQEDRRHLLERYRLRGCGEEGRRGWQRGHQGLTSCCSKGVTGMIPCSSR